MEDSEEERIFPFGESDFFVENFNPEQFLAKYSASCDLENLKCDLSEFLKQCENAIMSIMNKDYHSFISLAMRLDGLKEKMENIRTPLVESKERLQQHKEDLIKECEILVNLLNRYQILESKKRHLTQFLAIHNLITKSESIYEDLTHKDPTHMELVDYLLLERICRNISHTQKLFSTYTITDFPFLIICKDRCDTLRTKLISMLRQGFDRVIQGNQRNDKLHIILKCYVILDMIHEIESYYRESFVSPFLDSIITRERVDGDARNSGNGFSMLLETLLQYILNNCKTSLESSCDITIVGKPAFQFLLDSIWSPIVDYFFRRIPSIFTCGSHAIFQRNFCLADGFLPVEIEVICSDVAQFAPNSVGVRWVRTALECQTSTDHVFTLTTTDSFLLTGVSPSSGGYHEQSWQHPPVQ